MDGPMGNTHDHRIQTINRIIFLLAVIGVMIAIYVLQGFIRKTSIVCLNTGCELVRKHPASYLFGIPVPSFGLIGYFLLAVLSFLRTLNEKAWHLKAMGGIALFGVSFVSWFTYTEIFVIKGICTWCAVSTVTMMVICALVIKSYVLTSAIQKKKE